MSIIVLLILLSAISPFLLGGRSAYAQQQVPSNSGISLVGVNMQFQSRGSDDESADLRLYGEIQNDLYYAIENVRLIATFYDAERNELGGFTIRPYLDFLRPGERSSFDVSVSGAQDLEKFSYYIISKTWTMARAEAKQSLLDLNINDVYLDECGKYHIIGNVGNLGGGPATDTIVFGAFYNDKHQLISTGLTYAADEDDFTILPGHFKPFEIIMNQEVLPHFSYFSLNTQSHEYISKIDGESDSYSPLPSLHAPLSEPRPTMTVYTDKQFYSIGTHTIRIHGTILIDPQNTKDSENVLLTIIDAQGQVKNRFAVAVSTSGEFSREIDFLVEGGFSGQVFRIRAQHNGMIAENTFVIDSNSDHRCESNDEYIASVTQLSFQYDEFGNHIQSDKVKVGSPLHLTMIVNSNESRVQPITLIVEVFNEQGIAEFIHVINSTLTPNGSADPIYLNWTPNKTGIFIIKTFLISNLDNPQILADSLKTTFRIKE